MRKLTVAMIATVIGLISVGCGNSSAAEDAAVNKDQSKPGQTMPDKLATSDSAPGPAGGAGAGAPAKAETGP